jgi:undecaprenyl-diphosphatase
VWNAIAWGLIQGLTEFLPISSSGHLVLVPAVAGMEAPDLATSAVLHLGTLVAVLAYFRADLARMARMRRDDRKLIGLIVLGTVPAAVLGLAFTDWFDRLNERPGRVAAALAITGAVLIATRFLRLGSRRIGDLRAGDAVAIGLAQALALVPGISRSGATIAAGFGRSMDRVQAARFSFLLGIPAIAGAGLLNLADLFDAGRFDAALAVGMVTAAVSGYAAIALLLRLVGRVGLAPFGVYCVLAAAVSLVWG